MHDLGVITVYKVDIEKVRKRACETAHVNFYMHTWHHIQDFDLHLLQDGPW